EVSLVRTWTRDGTRLVPALRVEHARRRTCEVDFPLDGTGARFLSLADGSRRLSSIVEACTTDPGQRARLPLLAGALVEGGVLAEHRTTPGADQPSIEYLSMG
ncbi:hypothetical protein ACWEPC_22390, partial [Nonomuraea sp. NPDC004297]